MFNELALISSSDYEDSEYSDVENIIDDVDVEEKVGKLLRSMQPQMPLGNIAYHIPSNPDYLIGFSNSRLVTIIF